MEPRIEPPAYHGLKWYHRNGYNPPSSMRPLSNDHNHKIVSHFHSKGLERKTAHEGLLYGTDTQYTDGKASQGRRIDDRLSSDIRKYRRQQAEAEEDIRFYKDKKLKLQQEQLEEKKKDLEMLQQYQPWGKPAGGAPRMSPSGKVDTRRQKLSSSLNESSTTDAKKIYHPFGKPGGGAPLIDETGNTKAAITADPNTRFQYQLQKDVDAFRYKESSRQDRTRMPKKYYERRESELERAKIEKNKKANYAQRLEHQKNEMIEKKALQRTQEKESTPIYDPWKMNQVQRDDSGKVIQRHHHEPRSTYEDEKEGGWLPGLGKPTIRQHTKVKDKVAIHVDNDYNPWGKPGAGAPLNNDNGDTIAKLPKIRAKFEEKENDVDMTVAAWMRGGKVGQPRRNSKTEEIIENVHPKTTSDITAHRFGIRRGGAPVIDIRHHNHLIELALRRKREKEESKLYNTQEDIRHIDKLERTWKDIRKFASERQKEYHQDLEKLVSARKQKQKETRVQQLRKEEEHMKTFDDIWGRPGAGAPRLCGNGTIDTVPRHYSTLLTMTTHKGQEQFRTYK